MNKNRSTEKIEMSFIVAPIVSSNSCSLPQVLASLNTLIRRNARIAEIAPPEPDPPFASVRDNTKSRVDVKTMKQSKVLNLS